VAVCGEAVSHRTHRRLSHRRMVAAREKVREFNRGLLRSEYLTRSAKVNFGIDRLDNENDAAFKARIIAFMNEKP
jgi:hypothetical protein